jgi:hypothetical protein
MVAAVSSGGLIFEAKLPGVDVRYRTSGEQRFLRTLV